MMKKPDEAITQGNEAITALEATGAVVPGWLYALWVSRTWSPSTQKRG